MNWSDDFKYFDYALGVINDEETLDILKQIDFSKSGFCVEYFEILLQEEKYWETFKGKDKDVKEIYETKIDCYKKKYKYELEYMDNKGNIEIKIYYI